MLGADDEGIQRLSLHFRCVIANIEKGSWRHLPKTSKLKEHLRSLKLVDWKFRQKDIKDRQDIFTYDDDVKAMWPSGASLQGVISELRGKVRFFLKEYFLLFLLLLL